MKKIKRVFLAGLVVATMLGMSIMSSAATPSGSSTDANDIMIDDPDMNITDIANLVSGVSPEEVTGDTTLKGYSTVGVFSVIPVDGYDFSDGKSVPFSVTGLEDGMEVSVKMLTESGAWADVSFALGGNKITVTPVSAGQLAIFVNEEIDVDLDDEDLEATDADQEQEEEDSPKTGDPIPYAIALAGISGVMLVVSKKRLLAE